MSGMTRRRTIRGGGEGVAVGAEGALKRKANEEGVGPAKRVKGSRRKGPEAVDTSVGGDEGQPPGGVITPTGQGDDELAKLKEECRLKDELIKEKNELLAVKDRELEKKNKRIAMMLVAASTDSKKKKKAAGRWAGKRLTGDEYGNQVILQNNHRNFIWSQCKHLPRGWWVASEKKGTICSIDMEGLVLPAGMTTKKSYWDAKVASCFSFIHSTRMSRVRDLMKKEMHREYIIAFFLFRCATALTFVNIFVIDKEILDRKGVEGLISPEQMLKFVDLEENPTENMVMDISNFHLAFTVLNYDRKHIEGMLEDEDENGQAEDSLLDVLTVHDEAFAALQYVDLRDA